MIETIILAFIIAKLKKYKITPILKHWSIYPILMCAMIYVYLESTIWRGDYSLIGYTNIFKTIYLGCFLILAVKYDIMKEYFCGFGFVVLGTISNMIAMHFNNGKMPVFPSNTYWTGYLKPTTFTQSLLHKDFHILGNFHTHLIPLTDIFDISYSILSIGDVLVRTFAFIIVYYSIKKINENIF